MYLPVQPQPDCASAWLEATRLVDRQPGHEAHNVIIDIANPTARATLADPVVAKVNGFLAARDKAVESIANTIFPQALYERHGAPKFIEVFHEMVLPKVRKSDRWSGYYFERMTRVPKHTGEAIDQLWSIVTRIRDNNPSRNKFELSLFDPERDIDNSPYGGQCLSFLSFKLLPGVRRRLVLTAMYRNHYYTEKLLGNLIGLGRLMAFVAKESNVDVGSLTVVSTHAQIDLPKAATRHQVSTLLEQCS
jgi:thymidylate synthase